MKAFEFNNYFGDIKHKDDCCKIADYLNDIGKLNISERELSNYYTFFSVDKFNNNWANLTDDVLEDFAEWLSKEDVL